MPTKCDDFESDSDVELVDSSDEERKLHAYAAFSAQQRGVEDVLRVGLQGPGCPRRFIARIKPTMLYRLYVAYAIDSGRKKGSWQTFHRAFKMAFYEIGFLGFLKSSGEHSKCTACEGLSKKTH